MPQKPEISPGLTGHLARIQTLQIDTGEFNAGGSSAMD